MELEPYRGELVGGPSDDPGAPLTPVLDIPWLPPFPDARSDIGMRSDMRLALVAAM
ncbi:MAG TPA: hypothetical protein VK817_15965 [Trebonia sp.]|nr:hypothetical protein [Trebonia sp.]